MTERGPRVPMFEVTWEWARRELMRMGVSVKEPSASTLAKYRKDYEKRGLEVCEGCLLLKPIGKECDRCR